MSNLIPFLFLISTIIGGYLLIFFFKKETEKKESISKALSISYWLFDIYFIGGTITIEYKMHPLSLFSQADILWQVLGIILLIGGSLYGLWGIRTLSLKTTSALEEKNLVKKGPYKYCRNPQHLGFFIAFLGLSLYFNSFFILIISLILLMWSYFQAKIEEKWLCRLFGKEYEDYMKSVPRYIPRFRR